LDVEVAEINALIGASNTLLKHKPKLAISLYHKKHDLKLIPDILKYEFGYGDPVYISPGKYKVGVWDRAN
jgi:hypothetical protein